MALETFEYIDDLNTSNPVATDVKSEGDDHIRGIKTTLQNTFKGVTGPVCGWGASDPTVNEDSGDGYLIGSLYINTTDGEVFRCSSNAAAAAVWKKLTDEDHYHTEVLAVAIGDETTAITVATGVVTFRMPYAFTLTGVRASLSVAGGTSGTTTLDINEGGTTILSTKLTIDATEKTSTTAATAAVISDSALADDAEITVDVDAVSGAATEAGGKIYLIGHQ